MTGLPERNSFFMSVTKSNPDLTKLLRYLNLISFYSDFVCIAAPVNQTQISADLRFQGEDDVGLSRV